MVLNMADFRKSWKSLQTLWNACYTLLKLFLTPRATVCVDFGWIGKGRKSTDFEQKAWAIAHGFEHGGFSQVLEIAPNYLKRLLNPYKMICNSLRDSLCRLRFNSEESKIDRFWAKSLGYSPWFWTWRIFASPGNRSKLSEKSPKASWTISIFLRDCFCQFRVNSQGSKFGRFLAKSMGYSPWFWTWRIFASPGKHSKLSKTLPKPF